MSDSIKIRRALISVYDKTGIVDFARALHEEFGVEIISTEGTASTLTEAGVPVTLLEALTGFPEMLDGRVKTLHPKIHAAILADRDNPEHLRQLKEQGIEPIDMVVVNLYPFEETIAKPDCTFEEAIEMIDIGGPCLLRAAAKNHRHVMVVTNPSAYDSALGSLREGPLKDKSNTGIFSPVTSAFRETAHYDAIITEWLGEQSGGPPVDMPLWLWNWGQLRYGENPHQEAELCASGFGYPPYLDVVLASSPDGDDVQPKLSFNNYADASAALELCAELTRAGLPGPRRLKPAASHGKSNASDEEEPRAEARRSSSVSTRSAVCFIKHTNACGAALATPADDSPEASLVAALEAYRKAYLGDPNAAMGGILAVNFAVDAPFAEAVMETYQRWGKTAGAGGFFVEVWLAPAFDDEAVKAIRTRKKWGERVRLLDVGDMSVELDPSEMDFKRIAGGLLMQNRDLVSLNEEQWRVVTRREPTEQEMADLRLAWLICKHTKSNAVTICNDGMLIGNGAGQMSRVMSCRIATWLAKENGHKEKLDGAVAASDAFFPFCDGPELLIAAGAAAIIQPGGSKRDKEVIAACDERGVAMILTGTRHFKH